MEGLSGKEGSLSYFPWWERLVKISVQSYHSRSFVLK
ncbi:MAG: hypothetical protein ACI9NC_005815 [Verrucomicrobiales bacterium]|jgi:hypothetical protein